VTLCSKYYIAGRNCSGAIVAPAPANFYEINSYICGSRGTVKTTADFVSRFTSAQTAGGWLVLLLHGIDNDGGYSPLSSTILRESVQYLDGKKSTFWVAPFGNVVRYMKERNDVSVAETVVQDSSITLQVTETLDSKIFNYPITLRRPLPAGWSSATIQQNGNPVSSSIVMVSSAACVMFEAVPNGGEVVISQSGESQAPSAPTGLTASAGNGVILLNWAANTEKDIWGYNVYRSSTSGSGYQKKNSSIWTSSSYVDSGFTAGTYYYVVTAVNINGYESSYSNEVSATLTGGGGPTIMHVDSIVVGTAAAGGSNKRGKATVVIKDNNGNPVANATVTGGFSGTLNETRSGTTDSAGSVVIQTNGFQKTISSLTFCVNSVTHTTLSYAPAGNVETCDHL
jgi:hypothetical protein